MCYQTSPGVWMPEHCGEAERPEGYGNTVPGAPRKQITLADLHKVHVAVEHCLLRLLSRAQTIQALQKQGVVAFITATVWDRLEEQNPVYFEQYKAARVSLAWSEL
ncbi:hypothetical protein WJX81_002989 [Elliptochloris bilobata]|uniref:Uncharacterized protein n=1 Tax=Elliptochloris bilobata TaxID=381761 RepID=A0AAW1S552_9CHLO